MQCYVSVELNINRNIANMPKTQLDHQDLEKIISSTIETVLSEKIPTLLRESVEPKWLTTGEVMSLLKCSRRHIQYLRDTQQLPFTKNGNTIRYHIDDIDDFLASHRVSFAIKRSESQKDTRG